MTNTNNQNTALQVTNFDFYGDNLIALQDNATGEIYTAINSVLRGIGFTDKDKIRKRRDKWINDVVISKLVVKFNIPTQEVVTKKEPQQISKKKWSYWSTKMYQKYQLLTDYFHITHKELYKNLYMKLQNTYPDIDLNQDYAKIYTHTL